MARPSDPNAKIKLLTAAEAVFVERGLDKAKVEEITAHAGLSKGAFYLHFDSKQDAFRQLVESQLSRLAGFLDAGIRQAESYESSSHVDMLEQWLTLDVEVFDFIWSNRGVMGLLLEGGKCAEYCHLIDDFADRASLNMRRHVELGMERGYYRADLDLDVISVFIAGGYDRIARRLVRMPRRPNLRGWLGQIQALVISAIGAPDMVREVRALRGRKTGRASRVDSAAKAPRARAAERIAFSRDAKLAPPPVATGRAKRAKRAKRVAGLTENR